MDDENDDKARRRAVSPLVNAFWGAGISTPPRMSGAEFRAGLKQTWLMFCLTFVLCAGAGEVVASTTGSVWFGMAIGYVSALPATVVGVAIEARRARRRTVGHVTKERDGDE